MKFVLKVKTGTDVTGKLVQKETEEIIEGEYSELKESLRKKYFDNEETVVMKENSQWNSCICTAYRHVNGGILGTRVSLKPFEEEEELLF